MEKQLHRWKVPSSNPGLWHWLSKLQTSRTTTAIRLHHPAFACWLSKVPLAIDSWGPCTLLVRGRLVGAPCNGASNGEQQDAGGRDGSDGAWQTGLVASGLLGVRSFFAQLDARWDYGWLS